ncbi:MAG: hypothetical protein AMXMBFR48_15320 [Ignavibacteriales bacterium]
MKTLLIVLALAGVVQGQSVGVNYGLKGLGASGEVSIYNDNGFDLRFAGGVHFWWEGYGYKNLNLPAGMVVLSEVRERQAGFSFGFAGVFGKWYAGLGADVMPERIFRKSVVGEFYSEDGSRRRIGVYGAAGYEVTAGLKMVVLYSSERNWMGGVMFGL